MSLFLSVADFRFTIMCIKQAVLVLAAAKMRCKDRKLKCSLCWLVKDNSASAAEHQFSGHLHGYTRKSCFTVTSFTNILHSFFQQYRQLRERKERAQPPCLRVCPGHLLSSYVITADRRGRAWQGRASGGGLDITHQPQVFLLISSNGVALSREQSNGGDMSVIVWSVF